MAARVDGVALALVRGALAVLLALGCGGTTLSKDDRTGGDPDGGSTACTKAHEGDLVVRTPVELEALRDHRFVSGDLIVDCPDCTTLEPLGCLEEVGKMLSIVGCDQLESLDGLSALRRAGLRDQNGGIAIGFYFVPWETSGNARLRTLDGLGPLELVEGRVDVRKNPELRDLSGLRGLKNIAGALFVVDNDALGSLEDLSELQSTRGAFDVSDNDLLVDLSGLGALDRVLSFSVTGNDALVTFAGLDNFWGTSGSLDVHVSSNPVLEDVTALENLQGTLFGLQFSDNDSLRAVSLNPNLSILSAGLTLTDNLVLESFSAPGLTHVAEGIHIEDNAALTTVDVGAPASIGGLFLRDNGALSDTSTFAEVRVMTDLVLIEGNTVLERVSLPELQEVTADFRIAANPALTGLDLGALRSVERLEVTYNPLLPSCLVQDLLSSVASTGTPLACDNAPDGCAVACPPRP